MQSQVSKLMTSGRLRVRHHRWRRESCFRKSCSRLLFESPSSSRRSFFSTESSRSVGYFPINLYPRRQSTSSSLLASQAGDGDGDEEDDQVELFTASCMSQLLPRYSHLHNHSREHSSLDLELGEGSVWDRVLEQDEQQRIDQDWSEAISEESWPDEDGPPPSSETTTRPQQQQKIPTRRKRSAVELLSNFDPQNPPSTDNLEDLQLWLECEAQQEAVLRYQKAIDSARDRKDYSSLSMLQRQVVRWILPLSDEIANRQKEYMLKEGSYNQKNKKKAASRYRYGPYLCTLPASKLAVVVAHEAVMHALLKSAAKGGVSFLSMAKRIGEAVEEEVVIHRLLHKRLKDARTRLGLAEDEELPGAEDDNAPTDTEEDASEMPDKDTERKDAESSEVILEATRKWAYSSSHLRNYLDEISQQGPSAKKRRVISYAIRRARKILDSDEEWSTPEKIQLGAALLQMLLEKATIVAEGKDEMAFRYEKRWIRKDRLQSFIVLNDRLFKMLVSDKIQSFSATTTRYKPMILPPKPWVRHNEGGYLWLKTDLMRYHGSNTQKEALENADLSTIFDGLNALGRVRWRINERILQVAKHCWNNDIPLGDIPSRTDFDVPPEPSPPQHPATKLEKDTPEYKTYIQENQRYRDALTKYRRIKQRNMDLRSLRCSAILKLDQAEKFKDFDEIFFPYNLDFRGRAYPIPPHLSNIGSDLCRGMLMFSEAKPLGPRGLYWLKVHLANFAGKDKMSFDDRAKFVDDNMEKIRQSVEDPFAGERWWMTLEDPFQGLATCVEIVRAMDSGDPASYMCALPVHMDGSCNGLQHYAALGRDLVGGKAVNLCATEEPQDVYVGVMHEVIRRVAEEAERELDFDASDPDSLSRRQKKELNNHRAARLVNGLIDRGVVKRTVMTSVYGVTYIGARKQIQEKIESKLEAKGYDIDEINREIFVACGYLARVTMDVMGDLFTGAKETMNWLTTCARLISQYGYPVAWISPIGLPAVQPYRQKKSATIVTLLQTVTLTDESDDLPLHKQRQVSAFPPNYVHSLDSSHMLLTALEMDRRGLTFSAVHDSFWSHACDIDEMNAALREVFVDLYSQPLLEGLKQTWELRYPDLEFPDLPQRGKLDLNEVKKAKYFFQ